MNTSMIVILGLILTSLLTGVGVYDYRYSQRLAQTAKVEEQRADGRDALLELAKRQEIFFAKSKAYTTDLAALGYADITDLSVFSPKKHYKLVILSADENNYALAAEPQEEQLADTKCAGLTLTKQGMAKSARGPDTTACWQPPES
ncbi:MAG: type IV pilin protein [Magnetococcales bacterium]|nr:type IV pilin protein [Magnetococcales bacterium]MBF0260887.1 type IV pilin protein [Magnetococcales bacterium]